MVLCYESILLILKGKNIILSFILALFIKKILIMYIFINLLIIPRIIYIMYTKKIYTKNIIDCSIIKILLYLSSKKKKYEKIDTIIFMFINYLIIFVFPISIKSLKISQNLIKFLIIEIKLTDTFSFKRILNKLIKEEFLLNIKENEKENIIGEV
jgi:hypothetical protein